MKVIKSFLVGFLIVVLVMGATTVSAQKGCVGEKCPPTPTNTEATPTYTEVPTHTPTSTPTNTVTSTFTSTPTSTLESTATVTNTVTPTAFLTDPPKPSVTFTKPNTLQPPEYKETPNILLPTTGADRTNDAFNFFLIMIAFAIILVILFTTMDRDK